MWLRNGGSIIFCSIDLLSFGLVLIDVSLNAEFWKQVPPNEPYRVILGDVRDKLYQTRERSRQMLSHGISDIPEEATCTNIEQVSVCLSYIMVLLLVWTPPTFHEWNRDLLLHFPLDI